MAYRGRYPFAWMMRDFEDMMAEMDNRFWGAGERLLPPGGMADRILPAIRGEFRVDIREQDDEIMIVADLPGVDKDDVSVSLVNPSTIEISCERKMDQEEKEEGYYIRERMHGSMTRLVALPNEVTDKGATASFKNGVLEIRMKKSKEKRGNRIKID